MTAMLFDVAEANPTVLRAAIREGKRLAAEYVAANPEGPNWWPCGFANLHIKCRKNAKVAAVLKDEGFRWDDYRKSYAHGAYDWTNTQSMDYKEAILRVFQQALRDCGIPSNVETRID